MQQSQEPIPGPPAHADERAADRRATTWSAAGAILATIFVLLVSMAAAHLLVGLIDMRSPLPRGANGQGLAALVWMLASQAVVVFLTLGLARQGGSLRRSLALTPARHGWRDFAHCFALIVGLLALLNLVLYVLIRHDPFADLRLTAYLMRQDYWWLGLIVVGVGAPLSEELLFRGFLQTALAQSRLGFWPAGVVSTVAWTALHAGYSAIGLAEVGLIGVIFLWSLRRSGSLWVPIVCHALYNTALGLFVTFGPANL